MIASVAFCFSVRIPGRIPIWIPGRSSRRAWGAAIALAGLAVAACGDQPAHVTLVPIGGACGKPAGGNQVKVTAFTASGEHSQSLALNEAVAIADFPADTEQIGVEVIVGGGAIGAAGKSAPLAFNALADGAAIRVFMAPPDGFCEVGAMTEPRAQPLIARAGRGVLVVGGTGAAGPLSTAEYYDPDTATFAAIAVPPVLVDDAQGFAGAVLAALPDGRVALIGGPHNAFVVFDPEVQAFATDPVLIDPRAFHAAIATGARELVVAGGCSAVAAGACSGVPRRQMLRYHLDKLGVPDPIALLPATGAARIGAQLFDLGIQLDGGRRYLLAGGTGEPGAADRFALDDELATALTGGHVQAVALDGGAVLTAFGDDAPAAAPDGAAAVFAPDAIAARPIAKPPATKLVRMIALEDGRVVGFGGDPAGGVVTYDPTRDAWRTELAASTDQPGALAAPSLARLDDGSVLVTGGAVSPNAWLYRPSLIGPATGSITVVPASDTGRGALTAPDPATVTRVTGAAPAWLLEAPADAELARALVGGPRTATGSVRAIVHVVTGGVALIAQQTGPGQAIMAKLAPQQPVQIVRLDAGVERPLCSGAVALAAFDPAAPAVLQLAISDHDLRLAIDDLDVLVCGVAATDRGAWGIASLGAGARILVDSVTVAR